LTKKRKAQGLPKRQKTTDYGGIEGLEEENVGDSDEDDEESDLCLMYNSVRG
jgi:hypothetical protein